MVTLFQLVSLFLLNESLAQVMPDSTEPLFIEPMVSIPRKLIINPAKDLLLPGESVPLDRDEVARREKDKRDTDTLDPAPTDVWGGELTPQPKSYPQIDQSSDAMMDFDSFTVSPRDLFRARVLVGGRPYRLSMSWNLHSALMNARLLSLLGYTIDEPKHYFSGRVRFRSVSERDDFLKRLSAETGTLEERWLKEPVREGALEVVLRDFSLEPAQVATPPYHWGMVSKNEFQDRRVIRALLIPLVLTSIPDSINQWRPSFGTIVDERLLLEHRFAGNFQGEINYQDARWIARKIATLSSEALMDVIRAGRYPKEIEPLLFRKLVLRRNHLVKLFELPYPPLPRPDAISKRDELTGEWIIKDDKLVKKEFPDYGFTFAGEDPESPLRSAELFRYLKLRGIGAVLGAALEELNGRFLRYSAPELNKFKNESIGFVAGPLARAQVSASRRLVSGTYYGSEPKVQLADGFNLSVSAGYFGISKIRELKFPTFRGGVSATLTRQFQHVKPMLSITEAAETPWRDLTVRPKMKALARVLDAETDEALRTALNQFLEEFKMGENFSIEDSLQFREGIGANLPLPGAGSIGLGADFDQAMIKKTLIQRQETGVFQITLQKMKRKAQVFSGDHSLILESIRTEARRSHGEADSRVYVIDADKLIDLKPFQMALRDLLADHDSSKLERDFKNFELSHDLIGKTLRAKVLPASFARYKEKHVLTANPPGVPKSDTETRTLLSFRMKRLAGTDWLGFFSEAFSDITTQVLIPKLKANLNREEVQLDPAGSFMGKSHSKEIKIESELTPGRNPRTLMSLTEDYSGSVLSRDIMIKLLKRLEQKAVGPDARNEILVMEEFFSTKKLLLYELRAVLRVSGRGIERLEGMAKNCGDPACFRHALIDSGRVENGVANSLWVGRLWRKLKRLEVATNTIEVKSERLRQMFQIGAMLWRSANNEVLIRLFGKEDALFQIVASGFRKNDENGDVTYLSSSVGQNDPRVGVGAFTQFALDQMISPYEVNAIYLGNGL